MRKYLLFCPHPSGWAQVLVSFLCLLLSQGNSIDAKFHFTPRKLKAFGFFSMIQDTLSIVPGLLQKKPLLSGKGFLHVKQTNESAYRTSSVNEEGMATGPAGPLALTWARITRSPDLTFLNTCLISGVMAEPY